MKYNKIVLFLSVFILTNLLNAKTIDEIKIELSEKLNKSKIDFVESRKCVLEINTYSKIQKCLDLIKQEKKDYEKNQIIITNKKLEKILEKRRKLEQIKKAIKDERLEEERKKQIEIKKARDRESKENAYKTFLTKKKKEEKIIKEIEKESFEEKQKRYLAKKAQREKAIKESNKLKK